MALNGYIEFWVGGAAAEDPDAATRIGTPYCVGCSKELVTGLVFRGNGAICRDCLDDVRNELWARMGRVRSRPGLTAVCDHCDVPAPAESVGGQCTRCYAGTLVQVKEGG